MRPRWGGVDSKGAARPGRGSSSKGRKRRLRAAVMPHAARREPHELAPRSAANQPARAQRHPRAKTDTVSRRGFVRPHPGCRKSAEQLVKARLPRGRTGTLRRGSRAPPQRLRRKPGITEAPRPRRSAATPGLRQTCTLARCAKGSLRGFVARQRRPGTWDGIRAGGRPVCELPWE